MTFFKYSLLSEILRKSVDTMRKVGVKATTFLTGLPLCVS